MNKMEKNNKNGIDILKYVLSIFIILEHTIPMICFSRNYFTYGLLHMPQRLSVPLFFLMSSYFFFYDILKEPVEKRKDKFKKRILRWIKLYLIWSIIHFVVSSYDWFQKDTFDYESMIWYIKRYIILAKSGILWFLYSMIIGIIVTYFIGKILSKRMLFSVAALIIIFICVGDIYYGFMGDNSLLKIFYDQYYSVFITMRGGLTYGLAFGILGYLLAENQLLKNGDFVCTNKEKICGIICFLLYTIEGFLTFRLGTPKEYGLYLFAVPTIYFIFKWVSSIKINLSNPIYFRKTSSLIYFSHILIIFVWDRAFRTIGTPDSLYRGILGAMFTIIATSYIATIIYLLSQKRSFKFLQNLF